MIPPDDPLRGWIPFYLRHAQVHWGYMGEERFVEPFCLDSLQRLAERPFNQLLMHSTSLDALIKRAQAHPGLPLSGLIFHMGRCGSTLVAQSLAALSDVVMLSEPPPLHTLLGWLASSPDLDPVVGASLLQALVSAMGQPRREGDHKLFIKTDGFHIWHNNRILGAFPEVPWIFLYRDPIEVLVSQSRSLSAFVVPGSVALHGLMPPVELLSASTRHTAWVLSQTLQAAIDAFHKHPHGLLLNYSELPEALDTSIVSHFGLSFIDSDLPSWRTVRNRNAKFPSKQFVPDSAEKQASAEADVHAWALRLLEKPYRELERLRLNSVTRISPS